jgi:hypothetical protein
MRPKWLLAFLVMLQQVWSTRRDAHIRFLKLQVEILQSRLPGNRVILDPVERHRLMKVGAEVKHAVEHTLAIVSIKTYRRWQREEAGGKEPGRVGRPGLTKSLRELIIRLAKENEGWGVRRARVTQIMNLLQLAPEIQEAILFLPRTTKGRDPIREIMVRPIAAEPGWRKQRRLWKQLLEEQDVEISCYK